jgi:Ethylene-responsive protein kinase Le-CTR1
MSLPHGLHDQGCISPSNPLRPIEYFFEQRLMGDRTIIYVSLPRQYWEHSQASEFCFYRAPKVGQGFLGKSYPTNQKPVGLERLEGSLPPRDFLLEGPPSPDMPVDLSLEAILKQGKEAISTSQHSLEKLMVLADIVVDKMGGPVASHSSQDWRDSVDVGLSFLKRKLNSNCVPLGMIEQGNALHRAMLFKVNRSKIPPHTLIPVLVGLSMTLRKS